MTGGSKNALGVTGALRSTGGCESMRLIKGSDWGGTGCWESVVKAVRLSTRNPRAEIRRPKEFQRPKSEGRRNSKDRMPISEKQPSRRMRGFREQPLIR